MTQQLTLNLDDPETSQRRAALAAQVGIDPSGIRSVKIQLDVLRRQGLLVDVQIRGLSMFVRSATWLERGIADDDARRDRFTRGQKYLIPEEQVKRLRSVESQMRQALEDLSYRITGLYPYRWIPVTAYPEFRRRWQELSERFDEVKADILAHYDDYVDQLASDFTAVASASWRSIQAASHERGRQAVVNIDGHVFHDEYAFTDHVVAAVVARMPTRQAIADNLVADYSTGLVYGDQDVADDELAAAMLRAKADQEHEAVRHQIELDRQVKYERRVQVQAMIDIESEHARQRFEQMVSPFEEVLHYLRDRIAADAEEMLASIQKNGYVRGKIAEKGRGLLDLYDLMAAHNDYELREKLVRLKSAIGPVGDERTEDAPARDPGEIAGILNQVIDLSHAAAQDLLTGPSRFSMLDI